MPPTSYLVVKNPSPRSNQGRIIRCAVAFRCTEVILIGYDKFSTHGAHGSQKHMAYRCFAQWCEAAAYLHNRGCELHGLALPQFSESNGVGGNAENPLPLEPVHTRPFRGDAAFLIVESAEVAALCDKLLYVEQAPAPPLPLDGAVAFAIVLHHFAEWAGLASTSHQGEKFRVEEGPMEKVEGEDGSESSTSECAKCKQHEDQAQEPPKPRVRRRRKKGYLLVVQGSAPAGQAPPRRPRRGEGDARQGEGGDEDGLWEGMAAMWGAEEDNEEEEGEEPQRQEVPEDKKREMPIKNASMPS